MGIAPAYSSPVSSRNSPLISLNTPKHNQTPKSESSSNSAFSHASYSSVSSRESFNHVQKSSAMKPTVTNKPLPPVGNTRSKYDNRKSLPMLPSQQSRYLKGYGESQQPLHPQVHNPELVQHASQYQQSPAHPNYPQQQLHDYSGMNRPQSQPNSEYGDESSGSSSDYSDSSEDSENDSDSPAKKHPYYQQWKEYYEALERQKRQQGQKRVSEMYPGMGTNRYPENTDSGFYERATVNKQSGNFVSYSRQSTMRSNRSASVPASTHSGTATQVRAASITIANSNSVKDTSFDDTADSSFDSPRQLNANYSHPDLEIEDALKKVSVREDASDQISDYVAYLLGDDGASEDEKASSALQTVPSSRLHNWNNELQSEGKHEEPSDCDRTITTQPMDDIQRSMHRSPAVWKAISDLKRNYSTESISSYNSLQSEQNFFVAKSIKRVASHTRKRSSSRRKSKPSINKAFVPPIAGPPPPISKYHEESETRNSQTQRELSAIKRQSTGNIPMSALYMQQIQQQIQQLQSLQQMQQVQQMQQIHQLNRQTQTSRSQYSTDKFINEKIESFIHLRGLIASGNKTFEYRLKWLKMLIAAINYKIYAYVNIKGENISNELAGANKQHFIRSTVNHLHKLLKELSPASKTSSKEIYAEACYIQGCLYSNAYLNRYGQDFGYESDFDEAMRYFELCLDNHPGFFRAYYEIGELYEKQQYEDHISLAVENYKESARLGYNKAIYKIALVHLLVPKMRSSKFIKYLQKLAEIDMQSTEVQLDGSDRDELEEIVGLAQFQLGKIYEGIYPGDLEAEDDFVKECINIAPVSYSKSLNYYNKSAKLNCINAQVRLGQIYEEGDLERNVNPKKSIQWYIRASTSPLRFKRHPEAMLGLSRWFLRGSKGLSKHIPNPEPDRAVQWCERACKEFAYPEAFFQMGLLFEQGIAAGDARKWFEEAYNLGHYEAGQRLEQHPVR